MDALGREDHVVQRRILVARNGREHAALGHRVHPSLVVELGLDTHVLVVSHTNATGAGMVLGTFTLRDTYGNHVRVHPSHLFHHTIREIIYH